MFLFTTSPRGGSAASGGAPASTAAGSATAPAGPANPVTQAIREGAQATGTRFDYLLATARRESALDPSAKARTSSATGLFQFIEQTWLGTMKAEGARLGLAAEADRITARADGTYGVEDPAARKAILDLRNDPKVASTMAGALTQRNRAALQAETGREPSDADLYLAHFLGSRGASTLIRAAEAAPARAAAADFPEAAAANRGIFYDRSGRARGAAEVYALLGAAHGTATSAPPAASPPAEGAEPGRLSFQGLFQTDTRRGPVSDAVARLWRGGGEVTRVAALAYFPRSDGAASGSAAPGPSAAAAGTSSPVGEASVPVSATVPLPPRRPDAAPRRAAAPAPLDLSSFMGTSRT